jgi:hypothetical protein
VLLAAGLALYLPQFWAGQPLRIAHGLIVAAGCLLLAAGLWQGKRRGSGAGALTTQGRAVQPVLR